MAFSHQLHVEGPAQPPSYEPSEAAQGQVLADPCITNTEQFKHQWVLPRIDAPLC